MDDRKDDTIVCAARLTRVEFNPILDQNITMLRVWFSSALIVLAGFLAGCSKETNANPAEVRGEPIRGEKIEKPASNAVVKAAGELKACDAPLPKRILEKPEFTEVTFDKLAGYTFEVPEGVISTNDVGKSTEQIPGDVRVLSDTNVKLKGFMLPLKVDNGLVTELLIMKDQSMCCYGSIPRINDWVSVKMKNGGVKSVMDQPVTLYGKLKVGEMLENGYLVGIYQLDGEKMDEPQD